MPKKQKTNNHKKESEELSELQEIELLSKKIQSIELPCGSQTPCFGNDFDSFPLSNRTKEGLKLRKLITATEIQSVSIPHALLKRDILGAAKTGSGKTLAFVVPMLERLYIERWAHEDGLGALIITPTRELGLQIFDVIRAVGIKHQFSVGLITGGKKEFEEEQARVINMNILVATPGRLLQHLEQTSGFDVSKVFMLILDEADRILDMGFKQQLDYILSYLPCDRQTMLFSATQTKSVKDLARLSLNTPEYIAVHSHDPEATPSKLKQNYIIVPLHEKLNALFSFIKLHLKSKIIVFMSSCSQVRFVYECFRGMQPGISLLALHGKIKQEKRTTIFMDYTKRKNACLLATDIAARGLDFPDIDWVIQLDAPEDNAMYIHRVGRTARYTASGRALLFLMPQEERSFWNKIRDANIPLQRLSMNPNSAVSVTTKAASLLIAEPECRLLAKKAFTSYLRSLQLLHRNKDELVSKLDCDAFATSLGLAFTPPIPQIQSSEGSNENGIISDTKEKKNVNRALDKLKKQIKESKLAKKRAQGLIQDDENEKISSQVESEDDTEFLVVKSNNIDDFNVKRPRSESDASIEVTPAQLAKKMKKQKTVKIGIDGETSKGRLKESSKRVKFDEDGNQKEAFEYIATELGDNQETLDSLEENIKAHAQRIKAKIDQGRAADNIREKERIREKRSALKQKEKEAKSKHVLEEMQVTLENVDEELSDSDNNNSRSDNSIYSDNEDIDDIDLKQQEELALKLMKRK